jgi:DNA polymerase III epsilon subunit-like protein
MNPNDIQTTIDKLRPATEADIAAQREGMLNYGRGPRQAIPFQRRPYISVDVETTGTKPDFCQVLEFGAVIEDWVTPIEKLPRFHAYVYHDRFTGEAFGLALNAAILRKMHDASDAMKGKTKITFKGDLFVRPKILGRLVKEWLKANGIDAGPAVLAAGKNFAGFDRNFLQQLPDFNVQFIHRSIDPGMLFWNPDTDDTPPSTKDCMQRAGIPGEVAHTALEDALAVIRMIRYAKPPTITPPGPWIRPAPQLYSIAIKRDQRPFHTMAEAVNLIDEVRGVEYQSPLTDLANVRTIVTVKADETAVARIRELIGEFCHVEAEVNHSTQVVGPASVLAQRLSEHFMENGQFTK